MLLLWAAVVLYALLLTGAVIAVFCWGGREERHAMLAYIIASVGSQIAANAGTNWHHGVEWWNAFFELVLFSLLLFVVYESRKFWPLWAAAFSLIGVTTHAIRLIAPALNKELYVTIQPVWGVFVIIAILVGAKRGGDVETPIVAPKIIQSNNVS